MTALRQVDADFLALPRHHLADAALSAAVAAGASHADLRIHRITNEVAQLRDGELETSVVDREVGLAVRVIVDGTWGFASHAELDADVAAETARRAVQVARALAPLNAETIELAPEPVYADVSWVSNYRIDPFAVSGADKIGLLAEYSGRLLAADGVDHVSASLHAVKEQTFYADTFGSSITQQRVRVQPTLEAVAVDAAAGTFETMRTLAPPTARGWEVVDSHDVWDWSGELAQLPSLLAEKAKAPSVTAGPTDLVIDPSNLWLTIHESIGHATEYDRAIGYEAAYAGTSFATPDKLGTMKYGSPVMTVTADRTEEFGLASVGWDDEGVQAQRWDLVRDGIFVGYQLDRVFAPRLGMARSNGCSYADSPHHVPIQRMANVSLQPGADGLSTDDLIARVDDGIYVVGDKSWSIDMQRYNFQFTGQRFFRIRAGTLEGQLRDVAYQSTTTDFWGAMEAVGGRVDLATGRRIQLRQGATGAGRTGQPWLPFGVVPRHQRAQHPHRRGTVAVIAAQQVVDMALAEAARLGKADETIVTVTDRADAALRWANNSMTTNGVSVQRKTTVISIVRRGDHGHVASLTSSEVDPSVIPGLVAASQEAALSAPEARDSAPPLPATDEPSDWDAPIPGTGVEVFGGVADALTRGFPGPDLLYGYARHIVETTFVATSNGLRRRFTQPTGSVEINAKRDGASAWAGTSTPDFVDVPTDSMLEQLSTRLGWARRSVELPAGRYETILPPSAVADLMIYLAWSMEGRGAQEGRTALSAPGGGTRVGEKLSELPLTIYSDPAASQPGVPALRRGAQFLGAGFGVRQRHGHRQGRLDPRRHDQRAGLPSGSGRRVRRPGRGARG